MALISVELGSSNSQIKVAMHVESCLEKIIFDIEKYIC